MTKAPSIDVTDPVVEQLSELFASNGRQLHLVGGTVRDKLLGHDHYDLDFATDALPGQTKLILARAKPSAVYSVGEKYGTIGAVVQGRTVEITTYRSEQYAPRSRKPDVQFGDSLLGDLSRRDFTINSIAYNHTSRELVDPFDGLRDLKAGIIRAVGEPSQRFTEDPLRLLRAVRFAAQFEFRIEAGTGQAMKDCASSLRDISRERIGSELDRMLQSRRPSTGVRLLVKYGLAPFTLPEMLPMLGLHEVDYHHKDVFEHTLAVLDNCPPDLDLRWAALLHDIGKPATKSVTKGEVHFHGHEIVGADMARRVMGRLRYDSGRIEKVGLLVAMHMRPNLYDGDWTDGAVRRLVREAGDSLDQVFALSQADVTSHRAQKVENAVRRLSELRERCDYLIAEENVVRLSSPLDGNELMALFDRPPGPWIKGVKEYLLGLVLDGALSQDDKRTAAELAKEYIERNAA